MIELIITAVGAVVVSELFRLLHRALDNRKGRKTGQSEKIDALVEAQQLVMLDRIKFLGHCYIKDKEVDFDDRRLLNLMHRVYHDKLGGNGDLDVVMKQVNKLPLKGEH